MQALWSLLIHSCADCDLEGEAVGAYPYFNNQEWSLIPSEIANWYACQTMSRHERLVAHQLNNEGITTFLPTFTELHYWSDRRKKIEAPLFPGYLFARLNMAVHYRAAKYARGVLDLVAFGSIPAIVDDAIIEGLKARLRDGCVTLPAPVFSPGGLVHIHAGHLQGLEAVFEAVARGAADVGAQRGVRINWIFDAVRHFGVEPAREVLQVAARYLDKGVVAFGIGGDEVRGPAELFVDLYREARDLGLHTTAHAGETAGPQSVRAAVELLGAERIGHGLAAAQDPAVLALLRERGVPLEVSLTSNVATGALAQVSDHPLPRFLDEGVCVTLNSDDPGLFGTTLEQEFRLAAETFGLSREQLEGFTANAIHAAFLAEAEKSELRKALQAAL